MARQARRIHRHQVPAGKQVGAGGQLSSVLLQAGPCGVHDTRCVRVCAGQGMALALLLWSCRQLTEALHEWGIKFCVVCGVLCCALQA